MNYGGEEEDEESQSNSNGLRRHCSLSSRPPSSLGMLSQIPEMASESIAANFQYSHWNDPSSFIDNLSSLKRETEDDGKLFLGAQVTRFLPGLVVSNRFGYIKAHWHYSGVGFLDWFLEN